MSYYPNAPRDQSGCLETLLMIRVVFGILLVPMLMIAGAITFLLLALYAYTVHVLLTLVPVAIGGLVLYAVARWEKQRYDRDQPH